MDAAEREELKEQLRVMAAGRGDGVDLDSQDRWAVKGVQDPVAFFRHLALLIPADSILYFEGHRIVPEAVSFYEANRARNAICVVRDSIFPVPEVFHVSIGPGVIQGLVDLLSTHSRQNCFCHVKAYREEKLLFAFHDAFVGSELLISDRLSNEAVEAFCSKLGVTPRRERNENRRDPESLRRFLWALENPEQLKMLWPWWKRALFFWKK